MREVNSLIWAIVPCNHLASVNSRLMAVLSAAERRQLACSMLSDVLGALVDTAHLAGVLVASKVPTVKNIAGVVAYAFGEKCSLRHASAARARSIEPTIIASPTMGFNLDTPADLSRFAAAPSDTRTYGYLAESGIRDRLAGQRTGPLQNANMG